MNDVFANVLPQFLTNGEKLRMRLVKKNFLGRSTVMDGPSRVLRVSELNRLTRNGIFFTDVRLDLFNSVQDLDLVGNKYLKKVTVVSLVANVDRNLSIFYDCPNIEEFTVTHTYGGAPYDLGMLLDSLPNVHSATINGDVTTRFLRPSNKLELLDVNNLEGSPEFLKDRLRTLRAYSVSYDPSLLTGLESLTIDEEDGATDLSFRNPMPALRVLRLLNLGSSKTDLEAVARNATCLQELEVDVITDEFDLQFTANFRLPHLYKLDTTAVLNSSIAQTCPLLTVLKCHSFEPGCDSGHLAHLEDLEVFSGESLYQSAVQLPRLKNLVVCSMDSNVGSWVAAQTNLVQLRIRAYEETSFLPVPDSLEVVAVDYSNMLQSLDSLAGKKNLRKIKFEVLPHLLFLPSNLPDSLQEVDLREVHTLQNLTALSHKPNLKKLRVSNAHDLHWGDLVLPSLAELCVEGCRVGTADFKMFPNLVHLNLSDCSTTNNVFETLPTGLETLQLSMMNLATFSGVERLVHLTTLNVEHNYNLVGGQELASLTRLRTLNLACTSVGDLAFLARMTCLRDLNLSQLMLYSKLFLKKCGAALKERIDRVEI